MDLILDMQIKWFTMISIILICHSVSPVNPDKEAALFSMLYAI